MPEPSTLLLLVTSAAAQSLAPSRLAGRTVLFAGGGSGGHVFPALAVAEELLERGARVEWLGQAGSMEERLVGAAGIQFHPLAARPLVGPRSLAERARALVTSARSALRARRLVRERWVAAVLGTGGFVSAPGVVGGFAARVPTVLLEPNAEAGLANRWLSRFADLAVIAYPQAGARLRCPSELLGTPVRRAFFSLPPPAATAGALRILVLGGSQGSAVLNRRVPEALAELARRAPALRVDVLHQCGERHHETTAAAYRDAPAGLTVAVVPFIADPARALCDRDLVLSRAGAITCAELCAAGRPAVLVPLMLAGGHQQANARALEQAGCARVVDEHELERGALVALLDELRLAPCSLRVMGERGRALARPVASGRIAAHLERLRGGRA